MNSVTNIGVPSIQIGQRHDLDQMDSIPLSVHTPRPGQGGLAGRTIAQGNGEQREQTVSTADKAKSAFKMIGKVLGGIIAAPFAIGLGAVAAGALLAAKAISFIPKLVNEKLLEPRAEAQFKAANDPMIRDLATPMQNGVLSKEGVMAKLVTHAGNTGRPVSQQEIQDMVNTGERIAKALREEPGGGHLPLMVTVNGQQHQVSANTYMARCVGWYMMAQAASQDVDRAALHGDTRTSDMATSGSFAMKDPGNRMYNFLNSAPTAAPRMSTHFEERVDHTHKHKIVGLIPTSKPEQRGIEDYQSKMPGQGGTMLFDKLKPGETDGVPELFVKFESVGCPPYFKSEPHMGVGQKIARFFGALDRNIGHATNFLKSLGNHGGGANVVSRQEHVYKGVLKNTVNAGFKTLVDNAIASGVIDANAKAVGKSVHKFGLPYVQDAIATIQQSARALGNQQIAQECNDMIDTINREGVKLGFVSDQHEIVRRGAEAHISIV